VALYNAGDEAHTFTVKARSLDLDGKVEVFDLVERADMGVFTDEASIEVRPHAAKFYLLDAERRLDREIYEAETAYLTDYSELDGTSYGSLESSQIQGRAYYKAMDGASGGMAAVNLGKRDSNDLIWRDVHISKPGRYTFTFRCASPDERKFLVQIDGGERAALKCRATGGGFAEVHYRPTLSAGVHTVRLTNPYAPMPDVDSMHVAVIGD
jgi:hypothetical protein